MYPAIDTVEQFEHIVETLDSTTVALLDAPTPEARPSPYSKRCFTPALKAQQREVNKLRRE